MNFGILPLTFGQESDYDSIEQGYTVFIFGVPDVLRGGSELRLMNRTKNVGPTLWPELSE